MKSNHILLALTLTAALACSLLTASAVDKKDSKGKGKPYPLKTCVVSDEKLDTDPNMKSVSMVHEGQEIKFCCKDCVKDFKKDPAKFMKKIEEANKGKK